jgi:hypothetical protein
MGVPVAFLPLPSPHLAADAVSVAALAFDVPVVAVSCSPPDLLLEPQAASEMLRPATTTSGAPSARRRCPIVEVVIDLPPC